MNSETVDAFRWRAVPDGQALRRAAIHAILDSAAQAIHLRGVFHIVLSGGNTPREIYRGLRAARTKWSSWHIYFSDERCLPPGDPERNSRMARDAWLDHVPILSAHLHAIPGELGATRAAQLYAQALGAVDAFDLVLLGLGEDGHTASLFPGHEWGFAPSAPDTLAVFDAPKPPPERVSMSAARLAKAREVLFLVSGESKRDAVARWRAGENIPARSIRPAAGVDVLVESMLLSPAMRIDGEDKPN